MTGEEFVTAVVAGFEVAGRITAMLAHGRPQAPNRRGRRDRIRHGDGEAIGPRSADRPRPPWHGSIHGRRADGELRHLREALHAGRAAEAGYTAATLARTGWTADPAVFEGRQGFLAAYCDPQAAMNLSPARVASSGSRASLPTCPRGARWSPRRSRHGTRVPGRTCRRSGSARRSISQRGGPNLRRGPSFKPWPACGGNNAVLTAMFSLLGEEGFDRARVSRFEIVVPFDPERGAMFRINPADGLQGKYRPAPTESQWPGSTERSPISSYEESTYHRVRSAGLLDKMTSTRTDPDFLDQAAIRPTVDDCNWAALIAAMDDGSTRISWAFNRGIELSSAAVQGEVSVAHHRTTRRRQRRLRCSRSSAVSRWRGACSRSCRVRWADLSSRADL